MDWSEFSSCSASPSEIQSSYCRKEAQKGQEKSGKVFVLFVLLCGKKLLENRNLPEPAIND